MSVIDETTEIEAGTVLPHLDSPTPAGLARIARVLATRRALWRPLIQFDAENRYYTRFAGGEGWEAWLLAWLPGQTTGLHDHGDSSGAFVVLAGALEERTPRIESPQAPVTLATRRLSAGQLRSFGPEHLHDVINNDAVPAVSLHVYGPALRRMTRYVIDEDGALQVAVRERAGTDW